MSETLSEKAAVADRAKLYELLIAELTDLAVFVTDPNGVCLTWHVGIERILGYSEAEWIGHNTRMIFTPDDRAQGESEKERANAIRQGRAPDVRWHMRKDGSRLYADGTLIALKDSGGKLVGFAKVLRDITQRKQTEDARRLSEERLAFALDAGGGVGVWNWDVPENRVSCTRRFAQLYGLDPALAETGAPLESFLQSIHPEDRPAVDKMIEQVIRTGGDYSQEYRLLQTDGSIRWVFARGRCHLDKAGRPSVFPGVLFDITTRKESETALQLSEERFRTIAVERDAILGQLAEGVIATDAQGRIVLMNEAATRIHGLKRLEVGPQDYSRTYSLFTETGEPYPSEDLPLARAVLHGEAVNDARWRIRRQDGEEVLAIGSARPVYSPGGIQKGAVLTLRDNTARWRAEEALRRQWRTFDAMLAQITDSAHVLDRHCRWIYANQATLRVLNRSLDELVGHGFSEVLSVQEFPGLLGFEARLKQVLNTGLPFRDDTVYLGKTGEPRIFEYIISPILGDGGEIDSVAVVGRDVTERRASDEAERVRQEALRESARLESLGVMAGGVAHDFNNLLTGILGNASILVEDLQDSPLHRSRSIAEEIVLAAQRAADLTRQMLAYSGKGRFVIQVVELNSLIQENLPLFRASMSKNVDTDLVLGCDECVVEVDRAQILQVTMNLLINASEAIGDRPGKVAIYTALVVRPVPRTSAYLHTTIPAGRYAVVEVRDNGDGMSGETLKKIFDPFFTTKFTGRGLGLAAVLGIVKGHKGELEVESEVGRGTTFRVYLPISNRAMTRAVPEPVVKSLSSAWQTILVVDDEEVVRRVATTALESRGFRVLRAANGEEALEVWRSHPEIAAMIVDLTMPVMSGLQLISEVRAKAPDLPVVVSSGLSEVEVVSRFVDLKVAGFLQKPYSVAAVISKVTEALQTVI